MAASRLRKASPAGLARAFLLAAALAAFFMMLLHCLVENRRENRRLAQMAKDIRERGNA